jgi:hypothetical protein
VWRCDLICSIELERPADGQHVGLELAGPLPMGTQPSFLVHAGHVRARFANDAQRAAVFGRGADLAFGRGTQDATTFAE